MLSSQEAEARFDEVRDLQDQVTMLVRRGTTDVQQRKANTTHWQFGIWSSRTPGH